MSSSTCFDSSSALCPREMVHSVLPRVRKTPGPTKSFLIGAGRACMSSDGRIGSSTSIITTTVPSSCSERTLPCNWPSPDPDAARTLRVDLMTMLRNWDRASLHRQGLDTGELVSACAESAANRKLKMHPLNSLLAPYHFGILHNPLRILPNAILGPRHSDQSKTRNELTRPRPYVLPCRGNKDQPDSISSTVTVKTITTVQPTSSQGSRHRPKSRNHTPYARAPLKNGTASTVRLSVFVKRLNWSPCLTILMPTYQL